MRNLALQAVAGDLRRKLSSKRLDHAIAKLPPVTLRTPRADGSAPVTVCALQVKAVVYQSVDDMVNDIDRYMRKASDGGAELICFPELFGILSLGLSFIVRGALKLLKRSSHSADGRDALDLPALLEPFPFLYESYINLMARFACRYGVWLSCGTTFAVENGKIFNRHTLLSPQGAILGVGDKIHLTVDEMNLGITAGETLTVVPTPIGNIALTVCMDATYFETFRVAKALGADYALVPIGDMASFDPYLALRGAQSRVSETNLAAIKPALVTGDDFPIHLTGKAGVYYPIGFPSPNLEAESFDKPDAVIAQLDLQALRRNPPEPFCRANPAFDRIYIDTLIKKSGENCK